MATPTHTPIVCLFFGLFLFLFVFLSFLGGFVCLFFVFFLFCFVFSAKITWKDDPTIICSHLMAEWSVLASRKKIFRSPDLKYYTPNLILAYFVC